MDTIQLLLVSALSLFTLFFLMKSLIHPTKKKRMAPMAPGAWPVIGHLAVFENGQPTHVTFGNMADVHGPVFMTKLGSVNVLIINSQEVAKEIYTVHDKLLNRPVPTTASKLMGYNGSFFSFSAERSYWREIRRIAISDMLSTAVVDMQHGRAGEVEVVFRDFYKKWEQRSGTQKGVLVDMKQELHDLVQNISLMMIAGKRYFGGNPNCDIEEAKRCSKLIRDFLNYFGVYLFSDYMIPFLGLLDWKMKKAMKRTGNELDKILDDWVEEHKKKRKNCGSVYNEKNFLDRLIDIFAKHKNPGLDDAHTATKAICLNLVLSAPEAATVILVWAVSLLVNKPDVLRKAQEELDRVVGKDRIVEESDLKDLVYLQAIVKEILRLYPPVALTAYRTAIEDFDIANGNFHVPAGTLVLVNAWKIQRDPKIWSNPEKFEPERFLTTNREIDIGKQNYNLFPFGLGRKACPAVPLGMRMVQYVLARFLHSFDVVRPSSEYVDMTESNGLVNLKATPLEVLIAPRLHKSLYHVDYKA